MTIFQRAIEFVADGMTVGLGSGRASSRFIELLGRQARNGLRVRGVPTSEESMQLALDWGVPLASLEEIAQIDVTVDGADEFDPRLNLIKGYGRALVREKIVASISRRLVILVGEEKRVPVLGTRGKVPIEIVPFAVPTVKRRTAELGCPAKLVLIDGRPPHNDNGNVVAHCAVGPIADAAALDRTLRDIPGVVGTGLFVDMANIVLVGDDKTFELHQELRRGSSPAA